MSHRRRLPEDLHLLRLPSYQKMGGWQLLELYKYDRGHLKTRHVMVDENKRHDGSPPYYSQQEMHDGDKQAKQNTIHGFTQQQQSLRCLSS